MDKIHIFYSNIYRFVIIQFFFSFFFKNKNNLTKHRRCEDWLKSKKVKHCQSWMQITWTNQPGEQCTLNQLTGVNWLLNFHKAEDGGQDSNLLTPNNIMGKKACYLIFNFSTIFYGKHLCLINKKKYLNSYPFPILFIFFDTRNPRNSGEP